MLLRLAKIVVIKLTGGKAMEKSNLGLCGLKRGAVLLLGFLLVPFMFVNCAHQQQPLTAAMYRFSLDGENYRIRSITSADNQESYNEIIGPKFFAVDIDQDRIIDRIVLGDGTIKDAQRVYEKGLEMLDRENKLQERLAEVFRYVSEKADQFLEITSFYPVNASPFNEFKITDKRHLMAQPIAILDHKADGKLDEVLKGDVTLEQAQSQYAELIREGLEKNKLVQVDGTILVKRK